MTDRGTIEFYVDHAGKHRWRVVAGNGETVADSGQGYTTPSDCQAGAQITARVLAQELAPSA